MISLVCRVFLPVFWAIPLVQQEAPPPALSTDQIVLDSFRQSHDGWSADEVLLDDVRRARFLEAVRKHSADLSEQEINETLLRLRKAGKLRIKSTRRGQPPAERYRPAAEIAARLVIDRRQATTDLQVTTDMIVADPSLRTEFFREARRISPEVESYAALKWVLNLRKSRRLRPELVARVVDWQREIQTRSYQELRQSETVIPAQPGVYLFRDATGYLYIGEAKNLRERLREHLRTSDRQGLADYLEEHGGQDLTVELHVFPTDSPARQASHRRAYESDLIRTRQPRLNVRP
ncbi:nucleotide excision repair endonuclease [Planctomycetaceae bacterium SH139]